MSPTIELFLICALSAQPAGAQGYQINPGVEIQVIRTINGHTDEEDIKKKIRRNGEIEDIYIHENPQADKMREHGWERLPFTWDNKQIWIKRTPKSDARKMAITTSA